MKSTTFTIAAFGAAWAAATPLDKRALVTTIEYVIETVTVTGYPPAETPATNAVDPAPPAETTSVESDARGGWWGDWRSGGAGDSAAPPTQAPASDIPDPSSYAEAPSSAPAASLSSSATSPSVAASPSSSTPSPVSTSVSSDYQQGILDSHNIHRQNASVPDLTWSDDMASIAAQIAASCVYAHDTSTGGGGYGQNIGAGAPPEDIPAMITNEMYNAEINFYPGYGGEPDMSNFEKWGHYSQIVWKSTTSVGCATQYCPNGLANTGSDVSPYFTVCNYSPPGNFGGQYAANVLQPGNMPTVTL
ncbi:uncharacterized protein Z518_00034 [Rhinocladiella mackenziei CBS 650.93]|uniref:SCP domain-containing protein n=1 Tax=Rhinocladiella mackenziei CBS 650.93 TaxID=1442369 RepID=A0A0D2IZZ3_9EURO|nr:uncharacterized protein Z518_00034 [Rhinocladiella mackenziei CBS 650.93]KIX08956.1 hypothetical protein Z518_00034 [Rhinocladiella mackenziei CBS 650.93]